MRERRGEEEDGGEKRREKRSTYVVGFRMNVKIETQGPRSLEKGWAEFKEEEEGKKAMQLEGYMLRGQPLQLSPFLPETVSSALLLCYPLPSFLFALRSFLFLSFLSLLLVISSCFL